MKKIIGYATLIKANGVMITMERSEPFELKEMYDLIGCEMIEIVNTNNDRLMVIDEEGKLKNKPFNWEATSRYKFNKDDVIVGDALICDKCLIE